MSVFFSFWCSCRPPPLSRRRQQQLQQKSLTSAVRKKPIVFHVGFWQKSRGLFIFYLYSSLKKNKERKKKPLCDRDTSGRKSCSSLDCVLIVAMLFEVLNHFHSEWNLGRSNCFLLGDYSSLCFLLKLNEIEYEFNKILKFKHIWNESQWFFGVFK